MWLAKVGDVSAQLIDDRLVEYIEGLKLEGYVETTFNDNPLMTMQADGTWALDATKNNEAIKAKADKFILDVYSELNQRKMMSYMIKLQAKLIAGETLSASEQSTYDFILSVDAWITNVRIIENDAIANNTPLDEVDFTLAGEPPII